MTEMFGEAWSPMSVPDLAPDDDDDDTVLKLKSSNPWGPSLASCVLNTLPLCPQTVTKDHRVPLSS